MNLRQVIDTATQRFAGYAGLNTPDLPPYRTGALQVRLHRWQARNFPVSSSDELRLALGIVEELGEWAEAVEHEDEDDAIADAVIFSIQLCTSLRLDWGTLMREAFERRKHVAPVQDIIPAGRLAHAVLKGAQGIRGMDDKAKYRDRVATCLVELYTNLAHSQTDYCTMFELVERTAETVMKRVPKALPESRQVSIEVQA